MKLLSTLSLLGLLSLSLPVWAETVPSDVPSDHWAAQALSDLSSKYGFQLGYPDGTFRGERPVTRYEMAALLVKLLQQQAGKNVSPEDQALIARLRAALAPELETWKNEQQEALDLLRDETDRLADAQMSLKDDFAQALLKSLPFDLSGDIALRYELASAEPGDFSKALINTPQSRVTLSLNSRGQNVFDYGARLSVGNLRNPANPWWRLGDFNARVEFALDRFFITWRPAPWAEVTAGKFRNTFANSEIFMDTDVQPEGAMQRLSFSNVLPGVRHLSLSAGEFLINMPSGYASQPILQLSGKADAGFTIANWLEIDASAAYHQYVGESQLQNLPVPVVVPREAVLGNEMRNTEEGLALLNGGLKITLPFSPDFPLQLAGDYLYNLAATTARQGYQGSIQLGHTRRPGNFFVAYVFKHLEANGSLSLFVEDQLGGTDIMAHEGQVGVKVWDNTTLFSTVQWRQRLSTEDPGIWTVRAGIHQAF